jgi:mannose-6-phosphate isomerase-like protein (cupin superfamily)
MLTPIRRIVTGHNAAGRSMVLFDGPSHSTFENPVRPGQGLTELWVTACTPASNAGHTDAAERPLRLEPPPHGSLLRFFQLAPTPVGAAVSTEDLERQAAEVAAAMGASHTRVDTTRSPGMHKTKTVDDVVVLAGEVTMLLDEGEVDLKPFDVVIQRGTNHAWINRGAEPALLVAVLLDADAG